MNARIIIIYSATLNIVDGPMTLIIMVHFENEYVVLLSQKFVINDSTILKQSRWNKFPRTRIINFCENYSKFLIT